MTPRRQKNQKYKQTPLKIVKKLLRTINNKTEKFSKNKKWGKNPTIVGIFSHKKILIILIIFILLKNNQDK